MTPNVPIVIGWYLIEEGPRFHILSPKCIQVDGLVIYS